MQNLKEIDTNTLATKLLIKVTIDDDIKEKYPNFKFNYNDQQDFLLNNIICGFNHYKDEQEYDVGYEYFVVNELLETMEDFVKVGDKVAFIRKTGYMGKHPIISFGIVMSIEDETVCIKCLTTNVVVNRNKTEIATIYDFLEPIL